MMHMKIVIVVTRTFWRCAACKVLKKKSDSIDHHLESCHPQFINSEACRANISDWDKKIFEKDTLSDSEIVDKLGDTSDTDAISKCVQNARGQANPFSTTAPFSQLSGEHCEAKGAKADKQGTEKSSALSVDEQNRTEINPPSLAAPSMLLHGGCGEAKRVKRSTRKQPKRSIKQQTVETLDFLTTSDSDGDADSSAPAQDVDASHTEKSRRKGVASRERKVRESKPRSAKKHGTGKSSHSIAGRRAQKGRSKEKEDKVFPQKGEKSGDAVIEKVTNESAESVSGENKIGAKRGRRCKTGKSKTDVQLDDLFEPVTCSFQLDQFKSTLPSEHNEDKVVQESFATTDESYTNKKHNSISARGSGSNKLQSKSAEKQHPPVVKTKKLVDKTKIATSCAPWLFGTGRKAGDKVNKKPRRPLLPEEKQAVRELYGITAYEQLCKSLSALPGSSDGGLACVGEAQPVTRAATELHTSFPFQSHSSREDHSIVHRNVLLSIFPSGPPGFARASGNLFSGYEGMFQQQSEQYTVHSTDLYQMTGNSQLSQRNFTNYPSFDPVTSGPNEGKRNSQQHTDLSLTLLTPVPTQPDRVEGAVRLAGLTPEQTSAQQTSITEYQPINHSVLPSATQNFLSAGTLSQEKEKIAVTNASTLTPLKTDVQTTGIVQKVSSSQDLQGLDSQGKQHDVRQETFASPDLKQKHQQEYSSLRVFECKRCKRKFHGMHQLNVHVFSDHETEKQGFCFICDQDEEGLENLEKHVHKHIFGRESMISDVKYHNCRICKEEIQSVYGIVRTHYYQHHIAHVCGECFQNFNDIASYIEHCQIHADKVVFCSICGAEFPSTEELKSHFPCAQDAWAEDGMGSKCYKCGLWCPNRAVREAHRKQHRSQEDVEAYRKGAQKGFPCVSCEKVFKNKHACRRHMKMVHQGVSCYKHYCEYCGKGFLTKGHMRDHTAMHHLGIKRYKCQYCDQQFVCGPTLRRHVRKEHTKHKPYECEHCGERFFEKTPLQRHLTTHTGLAPFMCEHCGKGFYTKHSFTNHGTTHSTVRDFICKGCQKGFTRKYNLQVHMKICKLV